MVFEVFLRQSCYNNGCYQFSLDGQMISIINRTVRLVDNSMTEMLSRLRIEDIESVHEEGSAKVVNIANPSPKDYTIAKELISTYRKQQDPEQLAIMDYVEEHKDKITAIPHKAYIDDVGVLVFSKLPDGKIRAERI